MTKSDLRNGDICILRNEEVYLYIKDNIDNRYDLLSIDGGFMSIEDYTSNLTIKDGNKPWDIVKVYRVKFRPQLFKEIRNNNIDFESRNWDLIFERKKEVKKMTVAQICEELGYDIEIIKEVK